MHHDDFRRVGGHVVFIFGVARAGGLIAAFLQLNVEGALVLCVEVAVEAEIVGIETVPLLVTEAIDYSLLRIAEWEEASIPQVGRAVCQFEHRLVRGLINC